MNVSRRYWFRQIPKYLTFDVELELVEKLEVVFCSKASRGEDNWRQRNVEGHQGHALRIGSGANSP